MEGLIMKSKLSSKGQLIIPKAIRSSLALRSGSQFNIKTNNRKIILEPIEKDPSSNFLYGKYAGINLLGPLEGEHQQEIKNDQDLCS
jgi:AbrB family looped-hinge helix DNA binding protein